MLDHKRTEERVCDFVTRMTGVEETVFKSHRKTKQLVVARSVWAYVLRNLGFSIMELETLSGYHHTTMMHAIKLCEKSPHRAEVDAAAKIEFGDSYPQNAVPSSNKS